MKYRKCQARLQENTFARYHRGSRKADVHQGTSCCERKPVGWNNLLKYPDFIGIGAQKGGTTWAYEQLVSHPQVFVPDTKELNFFYSERSDSWYAQQFQDAPQDVVVGEVSPNYFVRPNIPQRMHELVPEVKLFCILRNPTERAFSQWKMARQLGNIPMEIPFIEAFRQNLRWMAEQGKYLALIERYEVYFPLGERFQVLFSDDIRFQPRKVLHSLYELIGVDSEFLSPRVDSVIGAATDPATITESDREEVQAFYRKSVSKLGDRFGRDLSHWSDRG